jgi:hypothetical protein
MFTFLALLAADPLDWRVVLDSPETAVTEINQWVLHASPLVDGYFVWPDEAERTITVFGWGRSSQPASAIRDDIRSRLEIVPFGRLVDVQVSVLPSEDFLREAQLQAFGAFTAPGGRCPGCGKAEPPHHPGCPWSR